MSSRFLRIVFDGQARFATVMAAVALFSGVAHAQRGEDRDSVVQITPYVWAAGLGGSATPFAGAPTFEASKSFFELLEDLDIAFFVTGLARKDRFVAVFDVSHASASREGIVRTGIPAIPVVPAEGKLKQTSATLLGGYRVVDDPSVSLDLLAGARAFWLDADVAVPAAGISRSPNVDFVDPIAAARVNVRLGDGWSLLAYGDVGGLGAGSEFTAQAAVTANARVRSNIWLSGGYRYLMVDYRGAALKADVRMAGPLLGATLVF